LVTGGAGFLGSHLCERLLTEGNDVICLDNFYTSTKDNIVNLFNNPHFEFVMHDITAPYFAEVDEIYNLACPASPIRYQSDPVQTTKTNVHGSLNMLELAKKSKAKILQASTSEIYGDPMTHPQAESYWGNVNPTGTRACYDEGKRCAETLFFDYNRQHGVKIKVARIFNTYGPRMQPNDGRVVSSFIVRALGNEDIVIHGDGLQSRSFCYVDDLIEGLINLMSTREGFTGPINLGNPDEITILDLAQRIREITNSQSHITHVSPLEDDPFQRRPVVDLARKELDWEPRAGLDEGLRRTVAYFRMLLSGSKRSPD
jgi:UDP-glucuronate decarboxylase